MRERVAHNAYMRYWKTKNRDHYNARQRLWRAVNRAHYNAWTRANWLKRKLKNGRP